jgi:hypothetical protein
MVSDAPSQQPEDNCADGPHRQRRRHREYNLRFADVKLGRQAVHQENEHEEIECIERPAEETGSDCMPMARRILV